MAWSKKAKGSASRGTIQLRTRGAAAGREGGPADARAGPADVVLDLALASNAEPQPGQGSEPCSWPGSGSVRRTGTGRQWSIGLWGYPSGLLHAGHAGWLYAPDARGANSGRAGRRVRGNSVQLDICCDASGGSRQQRHSSQRARHLLPAGRLGRWRHADSHGHRSGSWRRRGVRACAAGQPGPGANRGRIHRDRGHLPRPGAVRPAQR
jgi:hypothetical protein